MRGVSYWFLLVKSARLGFEQDRLWLFEGPGHVGWGLAFFVLFDVLQFAGSSCIATNYTRS